MPSKRTNDMTLKAESQSTEGGSDSEDLDQLEGEAGASPTMQSSPRRARHLAQGQACLKCRTRKTVSYLTSSLGDMSKAKGGRAVLGNRNVMLNSLSAPLASA